MSAAPALAPDLLARLSDVRALVLDVDGILTDGRLLYGDSGEEMKAFHIQDGLGIKLLQSAGLPVAIITSRRSPALERRARELGIEHLWLGVEHKLPAFQELLERLQLSADQCAVMGDDLPDLPLLTRCGFSATVPEAPQAIREHVVYVTRHPGGGGAVREVCELVLQYRGLWESTLKGYLA